MTERPHICRLTGRALVRVSGPDWRGFLQGLLTQDVDTLADGEIRYGGLLTPQGKLLYDLFLIGQADGCLIDVAAAHREALIQRLTLYRLRAKVEIAAVDGAVLAGWGGDPKPKSSRPDPGLGTLGVETGPAPTNAPHPEVLDAKRRASKDALSSPLRPSRPASRAPQDEELRGEPASGMTPIVWLADPRLPALGWRGYGLDATLADDVGGEAAYDAHRLALGAPDPTRDAPPESAYPIEANFDLLNGIDFHKGCFVGQETTSRMKRRDAIKSRMAGLSFEGPAPAFGTELLNGDLRAGEVLSGGEGRALALVRLDRLDGPLTVDGRPVRIERPGYFED